MLLGAWQHMEFFEVVRRRRSVRKYTTKPVPREVMEQAFAAAQLAPNSSNMQTWTVHWVRDETAKKALVQACLSQNAAATAAELVVVTSDRSMWRANRQALLDHLSKQAGGIPPVAEDYYKKLMPLVYGYAWAMPFKFMVATIAGLVRPFSRRPITRRDVDEVSIKSAALACENFMLAIAAQGFDTCPMEGFDEVRVSRIVGVHWPARVVMVISVGERAPDGVWGAQFRLPIESFVRVLG